MNRSAYRTTLYRMTRNEACLLFNRGLITAHEWRAFQLAHVWCAARFAGEAGEKQERFFNRSPGDGVEKANRLERRRAIARQLWREFCGGEHNG